MINPQGLVPTETLQAQLRGDPDIEEALAKMTPGQQVRVKFSAAVRQFAGIMALNPMVGLEILGLMEGELERSVDTMFMPHLQRAHRDAREDAERRIREEMEECATERRETPIDVATDIMQRLVAELNRQEAAFRAEGLPFSFSADPAFQGVGLQVPVARVVMP